MMESSNKLNGYLDKVCAEVRAKSMHSEIREELSGHFTDLMQERKQLGASEEEAQQYAITQLGDPQTIGRELHQIHKPRIPWGMLAAVLMLSAVSLLGMGLIEAVAFYQTNLAGLQLRQSLYIATGIALMIGMYFVNFKLLQRVSGIIYAAELLVITLKLLLGFEMLNGKFGVAVFSRFPFDLIGYSPYVFVVALAGIWTSPRFTLNWSRRSREMLNVALLLLPAGVYTAIRSYPELVVYLIVSLILYVWITRRWFTGALTAATFVAGGAIHVWNNINLRDRILGALDYNYMLNGPGYLNRKIYESMISAGWRGHGFEGTGEVLPYAYTDLFPVFLVQCFGWAGGLLFLSVVGWLCLKMIAYARAVRDSYGRMLIVALGLMLAIRLVYGLSLLSGRMVITSIPFPFLSYGQHVLIEFAAVGLLMAVYRRKDMLPGAGAPSAL